MFAPLPCRPPAPLRANTEAFLCPGASATQTIRPPLQRRLLWAALWERLLPGDAEHLSGPLLQRGSLGLESVAFLGGYESQPAFPQWLLEAPEPASLPPGGTHGRCSRSYRAPPARGWAPPASAKTGSFWAMPRLIFSLASSWERCLQSYARESLC